ncbi:MAG: molybdopterin-dependent oxidoreductase [Anaerolineaceae bacterium]|jgi:DMSO/TMAO reductase YedYZ molybdopterin-dependent catalytic subunit|nr:molybdopterin-dependent oxidoreductase [Anaerolineaceae bacterium]
MFKKTKQLLWALIIIVPMLLTGCSGVPKVEWELSISGDVSNPLTYTFDDLAKMEMVDLNDVLMEKSRGEDEVRSFSGVSLASLLEAAGASEDYSTITAIAGDGYAIEISKDEMTDGIVAMKQSGNWIVDEDPDAGPIRLVFPLTPANRWVFQIQEIIVNN